MYGHATGSVSIMLVYYCIALGYISCNPIVTLDH